MKRRIILSFCPSGKERKTGSRLSGKGRIYWKIRAFLTFWKMKWGSRPPRHEYCPGHENVAKSGQSAWQLTDAMESHAPCTVATFKTILPWMSFESLVYECWIINDEWWIEIRPVGALLPDCASGPFCRWIQFNSGTPSATSSPNIAWKIVEKVADFA